VTIYLEDRRVHAADWIQKFQHLLAGVPLLMVGIGKLAEGSEISMALLEITIAFGVFVTFAKEAYTASKGRHAASHSPISWFDLAAGILLIFEAFHGHRVKPGYLRPQFLSGVVTLMLGLVHGRLHARRSRRRYLKLDESGLEFRNGPFRRFAFAWSDLASVDLAGKRAVFFRKDGGQRTLRLTHIINRGEVHQALTDHVRAAGLLAEASATPRLVS